MKIPLRTGGEGLSGKATPHTNISESDILAAKRGDWAARANLTKALHPLLLTLAHKRASDPTLLGELLEAGRQGVIQAAKHYKPSLGAGRFSVFALDYIEVCMEEVLKKPRKGFWHRLFFRKR